MFTKRSQAKASQRSATPASAQSCREPSTGEELEPKATPGYYPGFRTLDQQNYWDAATRTLVLDRVLHVPPLRFFQEEEVPTMQAIIERILPQDDRTAGMRIPILPRIDERLHLNRLDGFRYEDMPSDQEAYRLAIAAIEAMAQELHQESFHLLPLLQQEIILQSLHDKKPLAREDLWQTMNVERFWTMLVTDCCAAYYAHPYAWDEIGFGGPAYPRGYMRLEEGEAEPWEKEERRYGWLAPIGTLTDQTPAQPEKDSLQTELPAGEAGVR
jgi:Gluconate 2-dehydrogenase subunit 3